MKPSDSFLPTRFGFYLVAALIIPGGHCCFLYPSGYCQGLLLPNYPFSFPRVWWVVLLRTAPFPTPLFIPPAGQPGMSPGGIHCRLRTLRDNGQSTFTGFLSSSRDQSFPLGFLSCCRQKYSGPGISLGMPEWSPDTGVARASSVHRPPLVHCGIPF